MTATEPLVSIGIPTFNRSQDLVRAVASVLAQDYANLEVIISDNASTDNTESVCLQLEAQHSRVRYVRQATNVGAIGNFTNALSLARGEYFMWLGDDDWIDPKYVSCCCAFLTANPDFVLACGRDLYFRGGVFSAAGPRINLIYADPKARVIEYFEKVTVNGMFYGLMRRSTLTPLAYPPKLAGDWLLMAQMAMSGRTMTLASVTLNRGEAGESQDLERHAVRLGYSEAEARDPWWQITKLCFVEIAFRLDAFKQLSFLKRLQLAMQVATTVFNRHCLPPDKPRLEAWSIVIRRKVKGPFDRHVRWRFKR